MSIDKPKEFLKANPKVSVIFPVYGGEGSPHYERHLREIRRQTYKDFEVVIVCGVSPNGRARNEGVKEARGSYFVFIDETVSLAHERVIENILRPLFENPKIGMTGASVKHQQPMSYVEKQYALIRDFESLVVNEVTDSWQIQHTCLAIPRAVYELVKGESNFLITGTDNDLRQRVHAAGLRMVLVPDTLVFYLVEGKSYFKLMQKSFQKGAGSAYAFLMFPGLFKSKFQNRYLALIDKFLISILKIFLPRYFLNPLSLTFEWAVMTGYVYGWFRWIREKPFVGRPDLL